MILILFALMYILTVSLLVYFHFKKVNSLKREILNSNSTNVLKEILKLGTKGEELSLAAKRIVLVIRRYFSVSYCTVYIMKNERLQIVHSNVDDGYKTLLEDYINKLMSGLEYEAQIRSSKTVLSYPTAYERQLQYSYFIPLKTSNEVIGAIHIENKSINKMDKITKEFFGIVIENITVVFQNMIYVEQLRLNGLLDGLTKVYNRRYMEDVLTKKIIDKEVYSVAMMDIDHFKRFNDTYGHKHGDKVLIEVSKLISQNLRNEDTLMRYGGEEFLIYFNDIDSQKAFNMLDILRKKIEQLKIYTDKGELTVVTASFGTSDTCSSRNLEELIKFADNALYTSKEAGRNKVSVYK